MKDHRKYCDHQYYKDKHCSVMMCKNYINKCPRHELTGSREMACNHANSKIFPS